jgi:hypothetical protein
MARPLELRDSVGVREATKFPSKRVLPMHDIILAAIFAAMILVPCIVASASGKSNEEEA